LAAIVAADRAIPSAVAEIGRSQIKYHLCPRDKTPRILMKSTKPMSIMKIKWILLAFFTIAGCVICYSWIAIPPIAPPKNAADVRFSKLFPLSWSIDDHLIFSANNILIQQWVENIAEMPMDQISVRTNSLYHTRYIPINGKDDEILDTIILRANRLKWMGIQTINKGFAIAKIGQTGGSLIYDSENEVAYYNRWD